MCLTICDRSVELNKHSWHAYTSPAKTAPSTDFFLLFCRRTFILMPGLLQNCVICASMELDGVSLQSLIEQMGGTHCLYPTRKCTHIITRNTRTRRFHYARTKFPDVPIVHPRWLWACFWMQVLASVEPFLTDFYTGTQRTGTFAFYGTRDQFFQELPLYQDAERHVGSQGNMLATYMSYPGYDDDNEKWGYISRKLQNTRFWGPKVREMNWNRRRKLVLPLKNHCSDNVKRVRRYMRACQDGPASAMLIVAALPTALQRVVIQYC